MGVNEDRRVETSHNNEDTRGESFSCELCCEVFNTISEYDEHLVCAHFKEKLQDRFKILDVMNNQQTMCPYCNQTFKNCMRFFSHLKSHGVIESMIADEKMAQQAQTSSNEEGAGNGRPINVENPLSEKTHK